MRTDGSAACLRRSMAMIALTLAGTFWTSGDGKAEVPDAAMKIVAFGTSLTATGGWQAALESRLAACLAQPVEVVTIAKNGSTTDWALEAVARVVAERPNVVLMEFYANDASVKHFRRVSTSRAAIESVLRTLRRGLPDARIVQMGMNPMHGLRGASRPFLDSFVAAHRDAGTSLGVEFIDFGPLWTARGEDWLADAIPDGVHPLPDAAVSVMMPNLVAALSGGRCPSPRN